MTMYKDMYFAKLKLKYSKKLVEKYKRLYLNYGLEDDHYYILTLKGQGKCEICGNTPKILCVDHLHIKGYKKMAPEQKRKYVRGLLCFQCNTAFGRLERRPNPRQLLANVTSYFSRYPMKGDHFDGKNT